MDKKLLSLLTAGLLASSVAYADVTLDTFDDAQAEIEDTTPGNGPVTSPAVTVANTGGQRTLAVDLVSQGVAGRDVTAEVAAGIYSLSNQSQAFGDGTITYSGLSANLRFQDNIIIQIVSVDAAAASGTPVVVTLNTSGGSASLTRNATTEGDLSFDFGGSSGINTASVTGLVIEVQGSSDNGTDMDIDLIRAVGPGPCQFNPNISATDPNCFQPCQFDPSIPVNSPDCQACEFNPSIPANSEQCVAPEIPPAVPGITTWGLITGLFGLPLIAGFFASRRRNK